MTPLDFLYIAAGAWLAAALTGAARRADRGRAAGVLRAVGARRRRRRGRRRLVAAVRRHAGGVSPGAPTVTGGPLQLQATSLAGVFTALLGVVAVAIALLRAPLPRAVTAERRCTWPPTTWRCWPASAVLAAGGMVTFLVAWETMSLACYLLILRHPRSAPVARGAFWFLALSEAGFLLVVAAFVILSSKTGYTTLAGIAAHARGRARRVAGRRLPAGAERIRVQGGPGPAARVAARGAPGRARRRVGVPVRRGRQAGRVRHRAVRVPARSAGRRLAWPDHHGRRRGDGGDRHPVRDGRTRHQAVPRLLHDREHGHHRDRVRRRHDLPRQRAAGAMDVPADRRASITSRTTAATRPCCSSRQA